MSAIEAILDPAFLDQLIEEIVAAVPADATPVEMRRTMVRMTLLAAKPADAMAAVLVAQALIAHYAAMDAYRRAAQTADDKLAARLRGNAAGLARAMRASLSAADARRERPEGSKPTRSRRPPTGEVADVATPSTPAPSPTAAPLAPLPRWETMTMEQRRAAYGYVHEGEEAGSLSAALTQPSPLGRGRSEER